MSASNGIVFPCHAVPSEGAQARLLGLYPQRQPGLLMQRVKVPGGVISTAQWRAVAGSAGRHAPGWPLHLTTRQDIEVHGLSPESVPALQRDLYAAGLTTVGACGDTLRNVTVCPGSGVCERSFDVAPLAAELARAGEAMPMVRTLPRKFKVSLSGCGQGCARPWINDLGLVAGPDGRFRAVLAGSLGPKPATGLLLEGVFEAWETVALLRAAMRLFDVEGDRANRGRARLRHARERLGNPEFVARLTTLFEEERAAPGARRAAPPPLAHSLPRRARLRLPLGNIDLPDAHSLADALGAAGARMRLGFEHDIFIFGTARPALPSALAAREEAPAVVACPGSAWCTRGIVDTHAPAVEIERALGRDFGGVVTISGCPNSCAQSGVGEVGLIGCIKTLAGERRPCFRLLLGGGMGRGPALAQEVHAGVDAVRIPAVLAAIASAWRTSGAAGGFGEYAAAHLAELREAVSAAEGRTGG